MDDEEIKRADNTAFGGLKPDSVQAAIAKGYITNVDMSRFGSQATPDEIARMLIGTTHHSLANAGGIEALKCIQDPAIQSAVLDSLVRHGMGDGAKVIQAGLKDINPDYVEEYQYDILKPNAIVALNNIDEAKRDEFLQKLGQRRFKLLKKKHNDLPETKKSGKYWNKDEETEGDFPRIQYFMRRRKK
ncbi:MAG: hypothetical protein HQL56_07260 [Magnetococcales bacterium]|nr:hypothetical protein [Magnetococcales bacterium]